MKLNNTCRISTQNIQVDPTQHEWKKFLAVVTSSGANYLGLLVKEGSHKYIMHCALIWPAPRVREHEGALQIIPSPALPVGGVDSATLVFDAPEIVQYSVDQSDRMRQVLEAIYLDAVCPSQIVRPQTNFIATP